jgi:hypothetical protein
VSENRAKGPIEAAAAILAAVVGDMGFAIIRRDAPPERIKGWLASIAEASRIPERKIS